MPNRDVVLTDHQAEMIETLVESGRYRDASEVISDALRLIEQRECGDSAKLEALRASVQVGVDAIENGDFRHFANMDEAIAYLTEITDDILEPVNGD